MQPSSPTLTKPPALTSARIVLHTWQIIWRQVSLCSCKPNSTRWMDVVFRMMIQFVILTRRYRPFRESVRHGDSIAIESLYNCFTPIWLATGKHHYFEICLTQMEELYRVIPFEILQIVRENRTVPLHKGMDKRGKRMAHWALDQIIELIQHKFKLMDFPNTV